MRELLMEVSHLSYVYSGDQAALHDVSAKIYKGERIAIVGANGAGKSTFFLNLNGVLAPHEGSIFYGGQQVKRDRKSLQELRRQVGIVFQDADSQIIASTVLAEVSFGPMNLKLPKEEVKSRVEEALSYMNIQEYKSRPPHYLSGGEKKRVSIADIIAMKPELIIFDEPAASLDPLNAEMLEHVLKRLSEEGKTLLISTHDVDFAYRWAERVLVFSGGRIIADGDPVEIFQRQEILETASLKKPMLLEVYEALTEAGKLKKGAEYPRNIDMLRKLLYNQ